MVERPRALMRDVVQLRGPIALGLLLGGGIFFAITRPPTPAFEAPALDPTPSPTSAFRAKPQRVADAGELSFSYRNCDEARAAGPTPILEGEPGYGPHLDGDDDGLACEPYRGRR